MTDNSHFLGQVEDILTWFSLAESRGKALPLSMFDGAEPLTEGYLASANGVADLGSLVPLLNERVKPSDVGGKCDVAWIGNSDAHQWTDDGARVPTGDDGGFRYGFMRVRVRHGADRIFRNTRDKTFTMSCIDVAAVRKDDARVESNTLFCGFKGGRWSPIGAGDPLYHHRVSIEHTELALKLAFARRYNWSVLIGYAGCPRLRFATDAYGARESFRLRDIPEGKSRRAALLHWVSEHWRQRRTDAAPHLVQKHLRGAEHFVWNGLRCSVEPAPFELDQLRAGGAG